MSFRSARQTQVARWCAAAFGASHARSLPQRGVRLAEEAIEAAQAAGVDRDMLHRLVDHVYSRPPGELGQEIGGVGITLLALADAAGLDAEAQEGREWLRIESLPLEHFAKRNAAKDAAGFNASQPPPPPAPPPCREFIGYAETKESKRRTEEWHAQKTARNVTTGAEASDDTARARELAERMLEPGPKASHLSASECHELGEEVLGLVADVDALRGFALAVFDSAGWPEIDGCSAEDLQSLGERYGLLAPVRADSPCGEVCACNDFGVDWPVTCYRKTARLRGAGEGAA